MLVACPFPLRVPFGVLLAALRAGRDNGQPIFPAQPVADAADLRVAFAVGNVLLMLRKIHSTENNMVMAMLLVDVGSNDILILAAKNFICKPPSDLVGLRIADLARLKGLYQVMGEIVAFLHGKQPCFFKLKVCGFHGAAERGHQQLIVGLCRINDIVNGFFQGAFDRMDLCNCHISAIAPLMSSMSCA